MTHDDVCRRIAALDERFKDWRHFHDRGIEHAKDCGFIINVTLETLAQYAPFETAHYGALPGVWDVYIPNPGTVYGYGNGYTLLEAWAKSYLAKLEHDAGRSS